MAKIEQQNKKIIKELKYVCAWIYIVLYYIEFVHVSWYLVWIYIVLYYIEFVHISCHLVWIYIVFYRSKHFIFNL